MATIELIKATQMATWMGTKLLLHTKARNSATRKIKRGQVYKCWFGENIGSEQCKERPCVIIQNNVGNIHSPNTIVAPITSEMGPPLVTLAIATQYDNGVDILHGNVLLGNMTTISKARLGDYITSLANSEIEDIDTRILTSLGLIGKFKKMSETINRDRAHIKKITQEKYELNQLLSDITAIIEEEQPQDLLLRLKQIVKKDEANT